MNSDQGKVKEAVRNGYTHRGGAMVSDGSPTAAGDNLLRLKIIVSMFGLGLGAVAHAGQVSRPYVSRVLGGGLQPSTRFLRSLESNLHTLIQQRHGQVFSIAVTQPPETLMAAAEGDMTVTANDLEAGKGR